MTLALGDITSDSVRTFIMFQLESGKQTGQVVILPHLTLFVKIILGFCIVWDSVMTNVHFLYQSGHLLVQPEWY